MSTSRMRGLIGSVGTVVLLTALAACGTTPPGQAEGPASSGPSGAPTTSGSAPGTPSATPTPTVAPVQLSANVKNKAKGVKVDTLVKVKADAGKVTKVKLSYIARDSQGKQQKGTVGGKTSANGKTWTATGRLEPAAAYTLTMKGVNAEKKATTEKTTFQTQNLSLNQQTFPTLYPLKGMDVGVGMPVVLSFDVAVKNKKAFEKNLVVKSSPAQAGSWHWYNDKEVRYRPKSYWKPGTKVTVSANVNGVHAGGGVYGQNSASTRFTVGRSLITKVNLATDVAKVYRGGKLVRTIYVSGGKPGWSTRSGIKLIMGKEYNKKMTNEMIGADEDYSLVAQYALRITNSGEFLHSAPWNSAYFGRRNASHGCVGMSNGDAAWLYNNTLVGDPVVTTGSNKGVEKGNGYSDWNVSWAQYKKGSAL